MNIRSLKYDEEMLKFANVEENQLAALCPHTNVMPLCADAAKSLGIIGGIPVVPAMADGALNQVGSGAMGEGMMTLSVGTSAAIRMARAEPLIPKQASTWCYYTAGKYLVGAATSGAANCVDWYVKDILKGSMTYSELENSRPDRVKAPIFMPFLFGERCPGWRDYIKGGFYHLTYECGNGENFYAILEGVLFNLYQCYLKLTEEIGEPKKIYVSGGICKSKLWTNMLCDIWNREVEVTLNEQASLVGGGGPRDFSRRRHRRHHEIFNPMIPWQCRLTTKTLHFTKKDFLNIWNYIIRFNIRPSCSMQGAEKGEAELNK